MGDRAIRIRASIEAHGWHVILVPEDDAGPGFAYSIGLKLSFDHPEVILFGLPIEVMHGIVNTIGLKVHSGRRFVPGETASDVLEGLPVRFEAVDPSYHEEYLGQAVHFYDPSGFTALQCYWPDDGGRFPRDVPPDDDFAAVQPSLQG